MRLPRLASLFALPLALGLVAGSAGCSAAVDDEAAANSEDELNYRSTAGQEFALTTRVTFKPSAAITALQGAEKDAAVRAKADELRLAVTTAITGELDRIWPEDQRISDAGVAIQFRQDTATTSALDATADGYAFTVNAEFAGINDLLRKLPLTTEGGKTFLPVPATLDGEALKLQVFITPIERSRNAYPKYLALFADGLDIAVHVGGDHNDPPKDIDHARSIYDDLVANGFRSPVARFEDLKIDSGPLTSAIKVKGAEVAVRVRIVHVDMSTPDTRQLLVDAYKASAKSADVVIYDGHAGRSLGYSGVVVAYKPARVAIPAATFKDIESTDKQQVYLFNGCETYTGYADELYKNPKRNPENTDVITTGNYSAIQSKANQVIAFIHSFIDGRGGAWIPRSWDSVLGRMNAVGERSWVHVYGVHGIDENPKVSPLADVRKVGASCTQDADCGAADSRCLQVSSSRKVCGVACADSAGCPSGTKCLLPRGRTSKDDYQCSAR
ncbi:MAG TPA: hypothetical protein PLR99_31065 [Polyangiaceae bacterium]|jgi:hypothetical protein|nr:hypothetical protein [Polyangiaceae bacterium]